MTSPTGTQAVDRAARLLTEVVHSPGSVTFTCACTVMSSTTVAAKPSAWRSSSKAPEASHAASQRRSPLKMASSAGAVSSWERDSRISD